MARSSISGIAGDDGSCIIGACALRPAGVTSTWEIATEYGRQRPQGLRSDLMNRAEEDYANWFDRLRLDRKRRGDGNCEGVSARTRTCRYCRPGGNRSGDKSGADCELPFLR